MAHRRAFRTRRLALFLAIGLASVGLTLVAYAADFHFLERLEVATVDTRFELRGRQGTPTNVVVVGVDDVTFDELGLRWMQFSRDMHARVIDELRRAGARAIAMDIQFTEETLPPFGCGRLCDPLEELFISQDTALIDAVYAARSSSPVSLATAESEGGATNVFGGNVLFYGGRPGDSRQLTDSDGAIRRLTYALEDLRSFAVVSAERALRHSIPRSDFPSAKPWIDFAGPPGAVPFISYSRVFNGRFDRSLVEGRVAVVGATSPTLGDSHETSTTRANEVMSGPEVQAAEIDTILRGFPLRDAPMWVDVLTICVLGLTPPLLGLLLPIGWAIAGSLALGFAYAAFAQFAFDHGTVLAVLYPTGVLVLATVAALGSAAVLAAFDRQRTRDTFARFVPEQVVDQVLGRRGALRLGGMRAEGTCMFTDVRDSTAFAESRSPETVVDVMNRYLGELTEAILQHGGTLVSYRGDGFMAIFGAPLEQEDHADRALEAAREILDTRLPSFNAWFREMGYGTGFRMGIGITTGPFVAGNVGSEKRLEYTAMGDTINTASRLEAATKKSGYSLFLAESTKDALTRPATDLVFVDEVDVRGRAGKVRIWSIAAARLPLPGESARDAVA
jgi:adenylate cyclase